MRSNNISLGQHWLKNRAILEEIADLAGEGEICVEIGPGLGTLTSSLLRRFNKVVAVEYDKNLAAKLPGSFPGTNLEVVSEDFLKFDLGKLPVGYVAVGNIPYYITSPIVEKILAVENRPTRAVLLMQKEVAERIAALKGSVLGLLVANRAEAKLGPVVERGEFEPAPKVDSQVLILEPHAPTYPEEMFRVVKMGFSNPRKKLSHNLVSLKAKNEIETILKEIGARADARPGDLGLEEWYKLWQSVV